MKCFGTSETSPKNKFENQYSLYFLNHEKCLVTEQPFIEIPFVMSRGLMRHKIERHENDARHIRSFIMTEQ